VTIPNFPSNPVNGQVYISPNGVFYEWSSEYDAWLNASLSSPGIPLGGIIMWSGAISEIPSGWALCNGLNGTPDLRNRFIVGSSVDSGGSSKTTITGSETTTGGNKNSIVPYHNHSSDSNGSHNHEAFIVGDGAHNHTIAFSDKGFAEGVWGDADNLNGTGQSVNIGGGGHTHGILMGDAGAHSHSISYAGTTGNEVNANLPPYYALALIMRIE
jgi:hypothetical protein